MFKGFEYFVHLRYFIEKQQTNLDYLRNIMFEVGSWIFESNRFWVDYGQRQWSGNAVGTDKLISVAHEFGIPSGTLTFYLLAWGFSMSIAMLVDTGYIYQDGDFPQAMSDHYLRVLPRMVRSFYSKHSQMICWHTWPTKRSTTSHMWLTTTKQVPPDMLFGMFTI